MSEIHFSDNLTLKHLGGTRYEVSGALVLFSDEESEADFSGDIFTKSTDFFLDDNDEITLPVLYNHGFDPVIGKSRLGIGRGRVTKDDKALWIKHELDTAKNVYDEMVVELIQARQRLHGKNFGWSAGTSKHLAEREPINKHYSKITKWGLAEASLTLIPQDWRQVEFDLAQLSETSIKSLLTNTANVDVSEASETSEDTQVSTEATQETDAESVDKPIVNTSTVEVIPMTENTQPEPQANVEPPTPAPDSHNEQMKALSQQVNELTKFMMDNAPRINRAGFNLSETGGRTDAEIKNFGDWCIAIARGDTTRLKSVYGTTKAQTEGSGTAGGFLVPEQFMPMLQRQINLNSNIPNLVTTVPVQSPSGKMPTLDYSTTPTAGSGATAEAAGLSTQARAEGGAYVEESISFEMLQYVVNDSLSGYVRSSKELLEDYAAIQSILIQRIAIAIASKKERDILRGSGVNEPLGILNAAALIGVNEDTDNTFAYEDALEMTTRFQPMGGQPVWIIHPEVYSQIGQFEVGTAGAASFAENLSRALPMTLLGYPILMSQHAPRIGADGYATLADLSSYYLFERGSVYIDYSPHADFMNGNDTWRFGQRIDGKPALTSVITLANPGSAFTVSPLVTINNLS